MTLGRYLNGRGFGVVSEAFSNGLVHSVTPTVELMGTNYADEFIRSFRREIEGLIGSDVILWHHHALSTGDVDEHATNVADAEYHHVNGTHDQNQASNWVRDFWHQDYFFHGLMSFHYPEQRLPRLSSTLITTNRAFERAFLDVLANLTTEKRRELLKSTASLLKWPSDESEWKVFFKRLDIALIAYTLQEKFPFFADALDEHLETLAFKQSWPSMQTTMTVHNRAVWHRRQHVKSGEIETGGILLKRGYQSV